MAIEPLVEALRLHPDIRGITLGKVEFKVALYADDLTLYLTQPFHSLSALNTIFIQFSKISGLQINYTESEIDPVFLTTQEQENLQKYFSQYRIGDI